MKIMSIIGIILYPICLTGTLVFAKLEASFGAALLGLLYALPFAIIVFVKANKK